MNHLERDIQITDYDQKYFQFTGKSSEFFGIWIVNIFLTILTLGIYSAWAKVRTHQYFYGNTILDDSAFHYLANPLQILKGRAIASLLFVFYYMLNAIFPLYGIGFAIIIMALVPAIIVLSLSFKMRNTGYRNITFHFERNFKRAYAIYAAPILVYGALFIIAIIMSIPQGPDPATASTLAKSEIENPPFAIFVVFLAMMLSYPFWEYLKANFVISNTFYGASRFNFETRAGSFYKLYILAFVLFIFVIVVFGFLLALLEGYPKQEIADPKLFSTGALVLGAIPFYLWAYAYVQTKKTNLIFNHTVINDMPLESNLTVTYMFFLYVTNTIAILLSLGLLIPWSMIRSARYRAKTLSLLTATSLDSFIANQQEQVSALGEEFGDIFDIDVGL